jgi:hypothetical protein
VPWQGLEQNDQALSLEAKRHRHVQLAGRGQAIHKQNVPPSQRNAGSHVSIADAPIGTTYFKWRNALLHRRYVRLEGGATSVMIGD